MEVTSMTERSLPDNILWMIYCSYFIQFVIPCVTDRECTSRVLSETPAPSNPLCGFWRSCLQSALSKANMYSQGKLDVTRLSADDRRCVFSELAHCNPQIYMHAGKTYITTQCDTISYNGVANEECPQMYVCPVGRYIISYCGFSGARCCETVAWGA